MDGLYDFGIALIEGIQTWPEALDGVMELFTFMGTIDFYLLLIPFIYWAVNPRLGIRVLMILIGTDYVGSVAKQALHQPRPYWLSESVAQRSTEISYGIPSTHASGSLAVWGALALKLRKHWLTAVAVIVILLVALSRLYLGVHFPHDILGGWLLGIVGLIVLVKYEDSIVSGFQRWSLGGQISIAFVISVLMAVVGWLVVALIAGSPDPESWASFSVDARSPSHYFTVAGAFFGAVAGYILVRQHITFDHIVPWGWRIGRYILGMAITLGLWQGLAVAFDLVAVDESTLGYILRYVRYGAVGIWITYGAPFVFQQWLRPSKGITPTVEA